MNTGRRRGRALSLALGMLIGLTVPALAAPRTVVSIKPIHSLVAGVMGTVGAPALLVSGFANPHAYSLRPSEARLLAQADLVVWVGPTLESFLVRPLASLPPGAKVLTLVDAKGLIVLPIRAGGLFERDSINSKDDDDAHAQGGVDGHIWLDPRNAQAIVDAVHEALSGLDPAHAQDYARNAAATKADLARLDEALARELAPVKIAPFIVFHDAYQYFEQRYGLAVAGSVTLGADTSAHARRISRLRNRIASDGVRCVFSEPQFNPALVQTVIEDTNARAGVLDHLGASLPEGPGFYDALMRQMAGALRECLAR